MRVISWNIRRNSECVDAAFDQLGADVLLAQECNVFQHPQYQSIGEKVDERWVKHSWGNVTFSKLPFENIRINTEYKGSLNFTKVRMKTSSLGLVNIYGLFEKISPDSKRKLATPGLHRKLSDLSPVLWGRLDIDVGGFLLAGDLNHDRRMDSHKSFRRKGSTPHAGLFKRIEDFRMTDLLFRNYPDGVQTYKAVRGDFPWQLDHAFVSNNLAAKSKATVDRIGLEKGFSDHNPIVIDIDNEL
jgi:exonuclease III